MIVQGIVVAHLIPVARLVRMAALGACALFALAMEAAAATQPLRCWLLGGERDSKNALQIDNETGRTIKAGARVTLTICDRSGCRKQVIVAQEDVPPGGELFWTWAGGDVTCTATVWIPDGPRGSDMGNRAVGTPRTPATPPRNEPPSVPVTVPCSIIRRTDGTLIISLHNNTGRDIPKPAKVEITVCSASGCYKFVPEAGDNALYVGTFGNDGPKAGENINVWIAPAGVTSCTAKIHVPPSFFTQGAYPGPSRSTRNQPARPPQPGLLESSPGFSRQAPSGIGTPPPPAAPPPSPPSPGKLR